MMSIMDKIKTYLLTCSMLSGKKININYLGADINGFSLENVASEPIVKKYSDGGTLKQFRFILASREGYDEDENENAKTEEFLETFERWIEEKNQKRELPDLSGLNLKAESIEVIRSGYLYDTSVTSAKFQIELRLLYRQN